MRKILFRGKSIEANKWIVGNYYRYYPKHIIVVDRRISGEADRIDHIEVHSETVGQFTGLTDKNGKEIYEGDIIEAIGSQAMPCRHIVRFSENHGGYVQYLFQAEDMRVEPFECGFLWQQYINAQGKYIIGNIHDNPELLNNK